jgi:hypothetical protein
MGEVKLLIGTAAGIAVALLLGAAQRPAALAKASPGLWEISGIPGAPGPVRQCIADPAALARIEHRAQSCTQVVIRDDAASALIHYTCPRGGFGRTKLTLLTPRSIRVETQGISDKLPFNYVVQARRVNDCGSH